MGVDFISGRASSLFVTNAGGLVAFICCLVKSGVGNLVYKKCFDSSVELRYQGL